MLTELLDAYRDACMAQAVAVVRWRHADPDSKIACDLAEAAALEAVTTFFEHNERKYREEYAIVDRVWKALGVTDYKGAGGKSIDELVAESRAKVQELEAAIRAQPHQHGYGFCAWDGPCMAVDCTPADCIWQRLAQTPESQ